MCANKITEAISRCELNRKTTMKPVGLFMLLIFSLAACKKCPDCGQNQFCDNGTCHCSRWYEGTPCVPIALKFSGKFVGTRYVNGANPRPDTFTFEWDTKTVNDVYSPLDSASTAFYTSNPWLNKLWQLTLTSSTEAICQVSGGGVSGDDNVNSGTATITKDGKNLVLSFSPLHFSATTSAYPDPDTIFTFMGTKQ